MVTRSYTVALSDRIMHHRSWRNDKHHFMHVEFFLSIPSMSSEMLSYKVITVLGWCFSKRDHRWRYMHLAISLENIESDGYAELWHHHTHHRIFEWVICIHRSQQKIPEEELLHSCSLSILHRCWPLHSSSFFLHISSVAVVPHTELETICVCAIHHCLFLQQTRVHTAPAEVELARRREKHGADEAADMSPCAGHRWSTWAACAPLHLKSHPSQTQHCYALSDLRNREMCGFCSISD